LVDEKEAEQEIARIRQRLTALYAERVELENALATVERKRASVRLLDEPSLFVDAPITNNSPSADKIALFRRLFAGRPDIVTAHLAVL
jgi:hypothetical protein